jgi:hypothetical protein
MSDSTVAKLISAAPVSDADARSGLIRLRGLHNTSETSRGAAHTLAVRLHELSLLQLAFKHQSHCMFPSLRGGGAHSSAPGELECFDLPDHPSLTRCAAALLRRRHRPEHGKNERSKPEAQQSDHAYPPVSRCRRRKLSMGRCTCMRIRNHHHYSQSLGSRCICSLARSSSHRSYMSSRSLHTWRCRPNPAGSRTPHRDRSRVAPRSGSSSVSASP